METPLLKKIIKQEKVTKLYKALLKLYRNRSNHPGARNKLHASDTQMALNSGITFYDSLCLVRTRNLESCSQAMRSKQK